MARAGVYARLVSSPDLLQQVSRESGIPASRIYAQGPFNPFAARQEQEPTAERRAAQLAGEGRVYQLRMETEPGLPVINVNAIAPTAAGAARLADGAAKGLTTYISELRPTVRRGQPDARVDLRQLGNARGVLVNPGVDRKIGFLLGFTVLAGWLLAVVLASNIIDDYRLTRRLEAVAYSSNGNGHGSTIPTKPDPDEFSQATPPLRSG